ncbi:hypothetical protein HF925_08575 [Acidithiobacillus ferriphilus]|uniref:hypothetical protein n=1 Tax=Acidithiobacillus ferriphilus TaxID=1689834 RepID=UPI001C07A1D1|nr:hypothetical protein [Acidithiobacillus ferriphilus]MBU2848632.1 hypothetical protein [Acidithiobacillus ferriphilus]
MGRPTHRQSVYRVDDFAPQGQRGAVVSAATEADRHLGIVYRVDGRRGLGFPAKRFRLPGRRPHYPFFILRSAFLSVDAFWGGFVYRVDVFLGRRFPGRRFYLPILGPSSTR